MRVFKRLIVPISISLIYCSSVYSQQIKLTPLPILQDATWLVTGISQDRHGYMWFGTKRTGLYRYDGYNTVSYKNQVSNSNSLSYDAIESIYADKEGVIWIGTFGRGLDRFDPATGKFTHYRSALSDPASLSNDTVICITEDKENNLWLGTYGGVSRLDKKTGKFTSFRHSGNDRSSLSCNQVRAIYQDKQGTIWVGTGSGFYENDVCTLGGLNRWDKKSGKFTRYLNAPNDKSTLIDNRVRSIFEDSRGTFYIGTAGDGLHTMDRLTGKFTRHLYDPAKPEKLSRPPLKYNLGIADDHITFITEDVRGAIWIGSFNGMNRYDPVTKKIKHYSSLNDKPAEINDNIAWMAYTSLDGVLWFSTLGTGNIYQLDPFLKKVDHVNIGDQVNCIYKDPGGTFWIGTQLTGLIKKDGKSVTQKSFPFASITAIRPNTDGQLWVGTISGLFLFNPATEKSIPYHLNMADSVSNPFIVSSLYLNRQGHLWIGTVQGLSFLNTKNGKFTHYEADIKDTASLSDRAVTSLLEDNRGRLWVGGHPDGGVNLFNEKTGKFAHYLKGRGITGTIYQDAQGIIWVGAHDGLYWYNANADNFRLLKDPATGASLDYILNILEDDKKNLWIVTGTELLKINEKRNRIIRFGKNEGVKPNTGYWGKNLGGDGSELFFGDQSGYYLYKPATITVNVRPPQILLTDFKVNVRNIKPGRNPLPGGKAQTINLKYDENVFSFNVAAIHFSNTSGNRLIYKLEDYDDSWREIGADQRVHYFNVPPGNYNLKMKAVNGNGVWIQKNFHIIIAPPWWKTWWAITLMTILLIVALYLLVLFRSKNLIKEKRLLEQKVDERTSEVVKQKEKISAQRDQLKHALSELQETQIVLVRQKEKISKQRDQVKQTLESLQNTQTQLVQREKMASLGELTAGIAHEIQNPLNFIKNFSEVSVEMMAEMENELASGNKEEGVALATDIRENLKKIIHHGNRADSIVKGMLHHSRSSSNRAESTDINNLVDECLRLTYHGLKAKDKIFSASFKTDYDKSIPEINIIPQDIGRVFLNTLTNAFYAVSEKNNLVNTTPGSPQSDYSPTVTVTTKKLKSEIEVRIKDNGNGIPQKIADKIFQPFFTTKPSGEGTGLGLSISYDIVKAHGGELKVETKEGDGAEFIILLPM